MTMEETIRRLGDAELEIMQAVWAAGEPVSSTYVSRPCGAAGTGPWGR